MIWRMLPTHQCPNNNSRSTPDDSSRLRGRLHGPGAGTGRVVVGVAVGEAGAVVLLLVARGRCERLRGVRRRAIMAEWPLLPP
jgi:hypothetical protein